MYYPITISFLELKFKASIILIKVQAFSFSEILFFNTCSWLVEFIRKLAKSEEIWYIFCILDDFSMSLIGVVLGPLLI